MASAIRITLTVEGSEPRLVAAGPVVRLGSGPEAEVRVPDLAVAPLHLRLERAGEQIVAMAAAAGVLVDGEPLAIDQARTVTGRTMVIGRTAIVAAPWHESPAVHTDSLARELMRDLLGAGAPPPPELVVERGPGVGQLRPLPAGARVVVGRGPESGWIVLDPQMSRTHVGFAHRDDGVYAWDAGAKNAPMVDDVALPRGEPGRLLAEGALIVLGATTLRLRDPAAPALAVLERGLAAARAAGGQGAVATVTRDLRRPAAAARSAPVPTTPRPRWPLMVTAAIALVAVVLAVVVIATW